MDLSKISKNDWIVVGGFVLLFIGTVAPWYGISVKWAGQTVASASVNGWHGSYLGWLDFFLCLAAAIVVVRKAISGLSFELPVTDAMVAMGAGGLSFLLVLIRLFVKPDLTGLRWGIFVALIGAAVVAVGGFLKNSEPVS